MLDLCKFLESDRSPSTLSSPTPPPQEQVIRDDGSVQRWRRLPPALGRSGLGRRPLRSAVIRYDQFRSGMMDVVGGGGRYRAGLQAALRDR